MIIIETKTGPCFVNEKAIESIEFDQDQEKVWVKSINNNAVIRIPTFSSVLQVRYVSDAQAIDCSYNSQEIEKLKHEADEKEEELARLLKKSNNQNKYFQGLLFRINARFPEILKEIEKEIDEENKILKKRQEQ